MLRVMALLIAVCCTLQGLKLSELAARFNTADQHKSEH